MIDSARLEALSRAGGLGSTPANIERVARSTSVEAARWAFTQWELRKRARAKFARADEMLFTREALEQASDERLAAHHASHFPAGSLVADLSAGIGADLIALAKRGPAVGYEIDPERAEYARWNLQIHGLEAEIMEHNCLEGDWDFRNAFADPSRRASGHRTLDPCQFSPNPAEIGARMRSLDNGVIKLSPMLPDSFLHSLSNEIWFLSVDGECREALAIFDSSTPDAPIKIAQKVDGGPYLVGGNAGARRDEPSTLLFDADPAAIRAGCLGRLCGEHGLEELGDSNGYLTGNQPMESPWLKGFEVVAHGRHDLAEVRRALEKAESAAPVLKQRHAGLDLQKLTKQLKMNGQRQLAVAFYPVGKSIRYVILEPLPPS